MKRSLLLICCLPFFAVAQDKALLVEGNSPHLYLNHTVAAKENYYSIGRLYNISPKAIAPFNKMTMEKGLSVGQTIKIPLLGDNFLQTGTAATDEATIPVYHVITAKESLYRIAANHNKLPVATLKQWNNLTSDAVSNGTKLIVGFLKVKRDQSALASKGEEMNSISKTEPIAKPVVDNNTKPIEETPVVKTPVPDEKKETPNEIKETPIKENPVIVKPVVNKEINFKGGAFKSLFNASGSQVKEEGMAGIFKSTSGWSDGKYYCLHNSAAPGTIIQISTPAGKSVYAKVLDMMPDIKQNNGLLICISNAAAQELGISDGNFSCSLSYAKK